MQPHDLMVFAAKHFIKCVMHGNTCAMHGNLCAMRSQSGVILLTNSKDYSTNK